MLRSNAMKQVIDITAIANTIIYQEAILEAWYAANEDTSTFTGLAALDKQEALIFFG